MGKDTRLQFRVTEALKQRADRAADTVGMDLTTLGAAAVEALCDYIEAHQEITMPLVVLPKSKAPGPLPGGRYANDDETKPVFAPSSSSHKTQPLNEPPTTYPRKESKHPNKE